MRWYHIILSKKPVIYALKTFLGAVICWYGLVLAGINNPLWAVITVVIVSDPDLSTAKTLAKMRVINTLVGCFAGLAALILFGYSPFICFLTMAATILIITSIGSYPSNWRLAPVTIIILMNAGMTATNRQDEVKFALIRAGEISIGCFVALILALAYTKYLQQNETLLQQGPTIDE